jgi:cbb3-type cytochrome c oxidase subunit III
MIRSRRNLGKSVLRRITSSGGATNTQKERNSSGMNNGNKVKALLILTAVITSSYALAGGGSANPSSTTMLADGPALFTAKCAICHGKDGRGLPNWRSKGQPDFTDAKWQKARTDTQIADATKNGKGKFMPAFKAKMSDEEITAVVARIRLFGKK